MSLSREEMIEITHCYVQFSRHNLLYDSFILHMNLIKVFMTHAMMKIKIKV